jgi:hypothetical protein
MIFRLVAGFLIGFVFALAVLFGVCEWLSPWSNLCGHNAPISGILLWLAGACVAWGLLFGWGFWNRSADDPPDYRY